MNTMPVDSTFATGRDSDSALNRPAVKMLLAVLGGALTGMLVSVTVNCTLVEISINGFFSMYFGILFILLGAAILYRIKSMSQSKSRLLLAFAILDITSGFICFFLEKNWFHSFSPASKVPLYSILGVAVCFALMFSIADLLNYLAVVIKSSRPNTRPLVESDAQVITLVVTSALMGFTFGLIFGIMDVEDVNIYMLKLVLAKEQYYCYPIGALFGGIWGGVNQRLRDQGPGYRFNPLSETDAFDRHF